jgi:hypothetical protein
VVLGFSWLAEKVMNKRKEQGISVGQLRGGGESVVTVLKQLCLF